MALKPRARLSHKGTPKQKVIQLQRLVTASSLLMREVVQQAIAMAPELVIEQADAAPLYEVAGLEGEYFASEWETGESEATTEPRFEPHETTLALMSHVEANSGFSPGELEQALGAIAAWRDSGSLPAGVPPEIASAIAEIQGLDRRIVRARVDVAFEVRVAAGKVRVNLTSTLADEVFLRRGRTLSHEGLSFFEGRALRTKILSELADVVLGELQAAFFGEESLESALLQLTPVPVSLRGELPITLPFKLDDVYWSRLGKLAVASPQGHFPFDVFLPSSASLQRAWSMIAQRRGLDAKGAQAWILDTAQQRLSSSTGFRSELWGHFTQWLERQVAPRQRKASPRSRNSDAK
jgi:hypothetical protein